MDSKSEDLEKGVRKHLGWGDSKYDAAQGKHGPKEGGGRWDPLGSFRQHFVYWSFISFLVCYHLYSVVQHNRENEGVRNPLIFLPHQNTSSHAPSSVCGAEPEDHRTIHMSPLCGTWQLEYKEKHRLRRAKLAEFVRRGLLDPQTGLPIPAWESLQPDALPRILIYVCSSQEDGIPCGGLGDSLKGFTTSLLYSALTERAVFMHWPLVHAAYESVEIDWTLPEGYILPRNNNEKWGDIERRGPDVAILNLINREMLTFQELHEIIGDTRIVIMRFNKGRVISWLHDNPEIHKKLGLSAPYAWGCLNRFLMRPKEVVSKPYQDIAQQLEDRETFSVCVHIRLNDEAMAGEKRGDLAMQLQSYMECVQSLMAYWMTPACKQSRIFLISSSYDLKQLAMANHSNVLTTSIKPAHIDRPKSETSEESMITTVAEWDLFSKCNMYVFENSGLSATASAYGLRPLSSFIIPRDFFGNKEVLKKVCTPWHPTARSDIANSWGGL